MSKKLKLVISVALLTWLGWRTDWSQVAHTFAQMRVELWLAAVGLYVLTQLLSGLRWQLLAEPLGFQQSSRQYLAFYFIGMYFNMFLPTSVGGDVIRAWYLDSNSGRRLAAFLSVFMDRLTGLLVLLALACGAAVLCPIALPGWIRGSVWCAAGSAVLGLLALPWLLRWSSRFAHLRPLADSARFYLSRHRLLLGTCGLSVVIQAANVVLVWLVGHAIAAPVPGVYYWIVVPMVTLLTLVPVSLNGMGLREGGMVLFLAPLQIDRGTALSLAFLWFSVATVVSLLGGVVYLLGYFPRPEVEPPHESFSDHSDQGRTGQSQAVA